MKTISIIFILLFSAVNISHAATISGTISLPANVTAGSSGVVLDVSTFPLQFEFTDSGFIVSSDTVTIAPGQNSASYTFEIPEPPSFDNYRLSFECTSGCDGLGVTTEGLWSVSEGVTSFVNATEFDSSVDNSIAILLESADTFSGIVNLPESVAATGDEFIIVNIRDSNPFSLSSFSVSGFLDPGQTSFPFTLGVPNGNFNGGWFVEVSCLSCGDTISEATQYTTTLAGDPLSLLEGQRFFYRVFNDYSGLSLTLITISPPSESSPTIVPVLGLLLDD